MPTCSKRLQKMISTMRERMEAKLFNSNDNAFKIRKLFLKFDKEGTGMVRWVGSHGVAWSRVYRASIYTNMAVVMAHTLNSYVRF